MASPSPLSDEQIRSLAAEILSRDDYYRPGVAEEAWRAALARVLGFFDYLEALRIASPILFWLIVAGLLLAALALLVHVVWTVRLALRMPRPGPRESAGDATGPAFLEQAEALAGEGRFLEAARRVELAALELLLRNRVIELSRSDPGRALREQVRRSGLPDAERDALVALQRRLEACLFRERAADRSLYRAWLDLHRRLESAVAAS